jgi:hypothetical protein
METCPDSLKQRELTEKIIGAFYDVYNELGHGFLEVIHERALAIALARSGIKWKGKCRCGFAFDFGLNPQFRRLVYGNERKKIRVDPRESAAS